MGLKGYKHTKEAKLKISISGKGRKSAKPMLGRKQTDSAKTKISKGNKGKVFSEEHRKKLSESHKGQKAWNKGKPSKRGEKHPLWKGTTPIKRQIRACFEYRQWRSDCMTRDDFTCVLCFVRGGDLEVDHIKTFIKIFEENSILSLGDALACSEFWNINNGRTLCKSCHKKVTFNNQ